MTRAGRYTSLAFVVWVLVGVVFLVPTVEHASPERIEALVGQPPELVLRFVRNLVARVGLALALLALVVGLGPRRLGLTPFFERFVGPARPSVLGFLRFATASILLVSTLWEDVAGVADVPASMRRAHGLFALVAALPGWDSFVSSASALTGFHVVTSLVLLAAALGLFSRVTVPLGAALYFVVAGLMRQPTWPYHTGLVPLYAMVVLAFFRTGDGFSLDAWRRGHGRPEAEAHYGWGRFAWVATLALPYAEAGLSKLCNGGLLWWEPVNMRAILYLDSLNPMEFDFDLGLAAAPLPDVFFAMLGLAAVGGEVAMLFVLFSRRVRLVAPAVMFGMHVGILFLQNILFFDLLGMLAATYVMAYFDRDGGPWDLVSFVRRRAREPRAQVLHDVAPEGGRVATSLPRAMPVALVVALVAWTFAIELFPFTAMQMYSHKRDTGVVDYYRITAIDGDGRRTEERPERVMPALRDGRYRRVLRACVETTPPRECDDFLAALLTRRSAEGVTAYEVEHLRWDFAHHPDAPREEVAARYRFPAPVATHTPRRDAGPL
ncbi:MAG: hypothetical protein KC586_02645 [Myxococcales bacterium]|nr:hypothetical protein [Myxococcales bacterium]